MLQYSPDQRPVNQWGKSIAKNLLIFHAFSMLFPSFLQEPHLSCIFIPALQRTAEQAMAGHSSMSGQEEVQQKMNHWGRKKIPKGIIKTLLKKEWKWRDLLEESMLPEEKKWCAFSTIIPYFFQLVTKFIDGEGLR